MAPKWITALLDRRGVDYEQLHHPDVFNALGLARCERISEKHVAKVVIVLCDKRLFQLVLPAIRRVDLQRTREWIPGRELRLATEREMGEYFPECELGAIPPLRCWPGIDVLMDSWMDVDGDIVFRAGTRRDAIRMPFKEWLEMLNPRVGLFTQPADSAQALAGATRSRDRAPGTGRRCGRQTSGV